MSRSRIVLLTAVAVLAGGAALGFAQSTPPTPSEPPAKAQPARPLKARVSTAVMLGLVEHKTMPIYPDEAMKKGIQGDAIFKIEVDETGKITAIVPLEGDPLLIAASENALQAFRFRPFLFNGTPVRVESRLGFHFSTEKTTDGVNGHVECMTSIPDHP